MAPDSAGRRWRAARAGVLAAVAFVGAGSPLWAQATAEDPGAAAAPAEAAEDDLSRARYGFVVSGLGPSSLVGGGLAVQPLRLVEAQLWLGYNHARASSTSADGRASADATANLTTVLGRARFWPLRHHSVIADLGLGVTHYGLDADGSDVTGEWLRYELSGTPLVSTLGAGYGYRRGWFRLALLVGAVVHFSDLPAGKVSTSSGFSEADRVDLAEDLDGVVDDLTAPRAYLELTLGALF